MKKITVLMMMLASLVVGTAIAKEDAPKEVAGATTVDTEQVLEMMETLDNLVVIDARKDTDFAAGHIDGAIKLTNTDVSADTLAEVLDGLENPVIFYCNGPKCGRSSDAAKRAIEAGYTNVYYYYGGIASWKEEGLPLVQ